MEKALFILHYSPPIHGAAKVGDSIKSSKILKESFKTKFIKIEASKHLDDIGKFSLSKLALLIKLWFSVSYTLLVFRPDKIYYTSSPSGFAFYRDLLIAFSFKCYRVFSSAEVFYHYHARGIKVFTSSSKLKRRLTNFFVKNVNLIFISEFMKFEIENLKGYKAVHYLKNGVNDIITNEDFNALLENRNKTAFVNVLFLSNMIKEKGYDTVLRLAKSLKQSETDNEFKFHFAGGWSSKEDEVFFKNYVTEHQLKQIVKYHGLVTGETKDALFKMANVFIFPSRYKLEVFPLSILEALSYGLPILGFDVGAVRDIIKPDIGLLSNEEKLQEDFMVFIKKYHNSKVSQNCRNTFINQYTINTFEKNLLSILKA